MRAYLANRVCRNNPLSAFQYNACHPEPTQLPTDTTVLVRVAYASVNPADLQYASGEYEHAPSHPMPQFPCPLGVDGAGVVVKVGNKVTKFKPGDHVLGLHQRMDEGTFAEIASFEKSELAIKPDTVCWQLAAALPVAGVTALSALLCCPALSVQSSSDSDNNPLTGSSRSASTLNRQASANFAAPDVAAGQAQAATTSKTIVQIHSQANHSSNHHAVQSILILGASGGVGSFAVLLAKHYFKIPFVIATSSGKNTDYVRQLGADITIDYTCQNVQQAVQHALQQYQLHQTAQQRNQIQSEPVGTNTAEDCSPTLHSEHQTVIHRSNLTDSTPVDFSNSKSSSRQQLDVVIDNVGGLQHMAMACRLLKPSTGLYVTSVPLADPSQPTLLSVLSFLARFAAYKFFHKFAPHMWPSVTFNGASTDGSKVELLVNWLAVNDDVVHCSSSDQCLVRLTEYALEDAVSALAAIHSRRAVGKLILRVTEMP